ncbi:hypothetical protein [Spongiimicrobium sp. 2-473A-2-J]|uniref:hypothetical protein n=1 Tax=Eudoraea algarum TaxID=3417568 RepID=UPI003D3625B9
MREEERQKEKRRKVEGKKKGTIPRFFAKLRLALNDKGEKEGKGKRKDERRKTEGRKRNTMQNTKRTVIPACLSAGKLDGGPARRRRESTNAEILCKASLYAE